MDTEMDEIARLKAQLEEERRGREEERRGREEERRGREEEQRRREEAQRRREEEERRREDAESLTRKQNLRNYLKSCHAVCILTKPITDMTRGTGGIISDPVHRMYPSHIRKWDDFSAQQSGVWDSLSTVESFWTAPGLISLAVLEFMRERMEPIGSEAELMENQFLTTQTMVKDIFSHMKSHFAMEGQLSFETHHSFQNSREEKSLSHAMQDHGVKEAPERYRRNRRADQTCVWREEQGSSTRPVIAIEYKSPHKLTVAMVATGLASEICPEQDIIDVFEDSTEFRSRNVMAAVVTQLFSYMIDIGVRYGYITTGEVYVFLHIPAEPGIVYCSVNIPKDDCENDPDNLQQRTAVAQVFAFIQQAVNAEPPCQAWTSKARSTLKRWKVEFHDILATIPETERVSREHSAYKPDRWVATRAIPFNLRHRCVPSEIESRPADNDDASSDEPGDKDGNPSPLKRYNTRSYTRLKADEQRPDAHGSGGASGSASASRQRLGHTPIQDRPYCTQECLTGLAEGRDIDLGCPNAVLHGSRHLPKPQFLRQLRKQLATDRGSDADCRPLYIHGARGAMLKLCLTTHGYTLVAKGMSAEDHSHLVHEAAIYRRLCHLQGKHIPACLGILRLRIPYIYQAVDLTHILLLSYGGRSLASQIRCGAALSTEPVMQRSTAALSAIHACGVHHRDAEPRNILYDPVAGTLLFIDFERSQMGDRKVLGELAPNRKRESSSEGKRQVKVVSQGHGLQMDLKRNFFVEEMTSMRCSLLCALE